MDSQFKIEPIDPIIRPSGLKQATGLSRATVYRMIARKEFPPAIQLSKQCRGWRKSTIDRWLAEREKAPEPEAV